MHEKKFEPFTDRLSRDIRNDLSESLVAVLDKNDLAPARRVAKQYRAMELDTCYREYIHERLDSYEQALVKISHSTNTDALWRALVLWDLGLFFEVHEILEIAWMRATGREKMLLQSMIRAAGVYIKLELGYDASAAKIAAKALPVLEENRQRLAVYTEPDILLCALRKLDRQPPLLLGTNRI